MIVISVLSVMNKEQDSSTSSTVGGGGGGGERRGGKLENIHQNILMEINYYHEIKKTQPKSSLCTIPRLLALFVGILLSPLKMARSPSILPTASSFS